jgi:hypothetical protein
MIDGAFRLEMKAIDYFFTLPVLCDLELVTHHRSRTRQTDEQNSQGQRGKLHCLRVVRGLNGGVMLVISGFSCSVRPRLSDMIATFIASYHLADFAFPTLFGSNKTRSTCN